jgi:hypothetical protein
MSGMSMDTDRDMGKCARGRCVNWAQVGLVKYMCLLEHDSVNVSESLERSLLRVAIGRAVHQRTHQLGSPP